MKYLTTLLALLLSCSMLAQGPVEFPWNPDSDGDDFIGVNDLMALLGEFNSVFSEEALYLSEDSTSAMYDAGTMGFFACHIACRNLPGRWSIPVPSDVLVIGQEMWLNSSLGEMESYEPFYLKANQRIGRDYSDYGHGCFCVTKERPKVEYTYCDGGDPSDAAFTQCINEKLAEGWYPLSGFPMDHSRQPSGSHNVSHISQTHASFWRWAE